MIILLILSILINVWLVLVIRDGSRMHLADKKFADERYQHLRLDFCEATGHSYEVWAYHKTGRLYADDPRYNVKITGIQS